MLKVKINDMTGGELISEDLKKQLADLASMAVEEEVGLEEVREVSLTFMDNESIQDLNVRYRDKDEPTDVLAFPMEGYLLGEIIVSLEQAGKQAEEFSHSLEREVGFLVVHGLLHLLGYEHREKSDRARMKEKEDKYLQEFEVFRR